MLKESGLFDKISSYDMELMIAEPTLLIRKSFTRDMWALATQYNIHDLQVTLAADPCYYINSDDLERLVEDRNFEMVKLFLDSGTKYHVKL